MTKTPSEKKNNLKNMYFGCLPPKIKELGSGTYSQNFGDDISYQNIYTASHKNATIKSYDQNTENICLYLWKQFLKCNTVYMYMYIYIYIYPPAPLVWATRLLKVRLVFQSSVSSFWYRFCSFGSVLFSSLEFLVSGLWQLANG